MRAKSILSLVALLVVLLASASVSVSADASAAAAAVADGTVTDKGSPDEKKPATDAADAAGADADEDDDADPEADVETEGDGYPEGEGDALLDALAEQGGLEGEDEYLMDAAEIEAIQNEARAWAGHMKPLASANLKIPVPELAAFPAPADFFAKYVRESAAVIIRGGAASMPAFTKWTDAYLAAAHGADTIESYVEAFKKENRTLALLTEPINSTLSQFVASYTIPTATGELPEPIYVSDLLPSLKADVVLPTSLQCAPLAPAFSRAVLHLNSGGARSVLHHEHSEAMHCVLDGSQTFSLLNPATTDEFVTVDTEDPVTGEFVNTNVDAVDATLHPGMMKVVFHEAVLSKGDCIYIPALWLQAHKSKVGARYLGLGLWWSHNAEMEHDVLAGKCEVAEDLTKSKQDKEAAAAVAATAAGGSASASSSVKELLAVQESTLGEGGVWSLDKALLVDEVYVLTPQQRAELSVKYDENTVVTDGTDADADADAEGEDDDDDEDAATAAAATDAAEDAAPATKGLKDEL